ncbi:MAG: hypothetical protein E4G99_05395 [Anaerolineales bacterium]|nr:MAG: hypothetical protein E4G99_05395 [Anaerolineales bacterium]
MKHMSLLSKFWQGWKRVGGFIGDVLGRLVLTLLYFTLVLPFGLLMRFFRDPLALRRNGPPAWQSRKPDDATMEAARRLS